MHDTAVQFSGGVKNTAVLSKKAVTAKSPFQDRLKNK